MSYNDGGLPDYPSPEYHVAVSQSNRSPPGSAVPWGSFPHIPVKPLTSRSPNGGGPLVRSTSRRLPTTPPERYLYTYSLVAGTAPIQFTISVEPETGRAEPGKCTFRLSLKVDKVERPLGEPVQLRLAVDPRGLDFYVFVFPGKSTLPIGCLYSYRVWLRVNGIEHRIFGEDELWIAKDPDFSSIENITFARIKNITTNAQIYEIVVGKAHVQFIVQWRLLADNLYKYTLDYDANGVGGTLIDDFRLILDGGDPRKVSFMIYSVPMNSMPAGASHRIRVWLKTLLPANRGNTSSSASAYSVSYNDSYVYQRIWKTDNFKLGAQLDFGSLGSKMIVGFSNGPPQTVIVPPSAHGNMLHNKDNDRPRDIRDIG